MHLPTSITVATSFVPVTCHPLEPLLHTSARPNGVSACKHRLGSPLIGRHTLLQSLQDSRGECRPMRGNVSIVAAGGGGGNNIVPGVGGGSSTASSRISSGSGGSSGSLPWEEAFVAQNAEALRLVPLVAGGMGGALVLFNRLASGIPAVADAGSAQSRTDVLSLVLAASLVLTGLSWLSLKPRTPVAVELQGVPCLRFADSLPSDAVDELRWAWDTLSLNTRCRSAVVVYGGQCVMQAGVMLAAPNGRSEAVEVDVRALWSGSICTNVRKSGKANYLANLALFPARFDLLQFLPSNSQAAIIQPLGDNDGVLIVGSDTVRGFTPLDQAWMASIGEKLDATLGRSFPCGSSTGGV